VRNAPDHHAIVCDDPGAPHLTVESAAGLKDRSDVATGAAVNRLVEAGILTQPNIGRERYRSL